MKRRATEEREIARSMAGIGDEVKAATRYGRNAGINEALIELFRLRPEWRDE